ncbi:hypothetical protein [Devosia sp. A16]|nr:hypothetical protein [Devosia sp. A16]
MRLFPAYRLEARRGCRQAALAVPEDRELARRQLDQQDLQLRRC